MKPSGPAWPQLSLRTRRVRTRLGDICSHLNPTTAAEGGGKGTRGQGYKGERVLACNSTSDVLKLVCSLMRHHKGRVHPGCRRSGGIHAIHLSLFTKHDPFTLSPGPPQKKFSTNGPSIQTNKSASVFASAKSEGGSKIKPFISWLLCFQRKY
jgi:hypothetical protein